MTEDNWDTFTGSISITPIMCSTHNAYVTSYWEFLDWAEQKTKQGERQVQCPKCGRWLFDCENTPATVADGSTEAP